jgi:hypothetical protein
MAFGVQSLGAAARKDFRGVSVVREHLPHRPYHSVFTWLKAPRFVILLLASETPFGGAHHCHTGEEELYTESKEPF